MFDATRIATPAGPALLHRSARTTLAISVLPDGSLELVAPEDVRMIDIVEKVVKRRRWIERQRVEFADMRRNRIPLRYESGATHTYIGRQYRLKVKRGDPIGVRLIGAYFQVMSRSGTPKEVETLLRAWLRQKAKEQFSKRLAKWEPWCRHHRLPIPRVRLLTMAKRWGSAQSDGRIAMNPVLVRSPSICIDYVIAHEVCHLKHPQHNRTFFRQLDTIFPDWRLAKARLESAVTI